MIYQEDTEAFVGSISLARSNGAFTFINRRHIQGNGCGL